MAIQEIKFEFDIPDGYQFVRYGIPVKDEKYLVGGNKIYTAAANHDKNGYNYIIVEEIPHYELMKAFEKGAEIQFLSGYCGKWMDIKSGIPLWAPEQKYRIKPSIKKVKFKIYIDKTGKPGLVENELLIPEDNLMVTDWFECDVEL